MGGNNWDTLDDYHDNIDIGVTAKINTPTYYRSGKGGIRNPADTFTTKFVNSAIVADRNLTIPLLAADDTMAVLGVAQTHTEPRTIMKDAVDLFTLYKDNSTNGTVWELNFDAKDSGGLQSPYAAIRPEIQSNVAGSESGLLSLVVNVAGTETKGLTIEQDARVVLGGVNRRIRLDEAGLAALRTFTFPDATGKLVNEATAATLTNKTMDVKDNPLALRFYTTKVFKVGSTYYAKKWDGTLVSSGATFETVFNAALALKGTVLLTNTETSATGTTSYTITASSGTIFTITGNTRIISDYGAFLEVPQGSTAIVLKVNGAGTFQPAESLGIQGLSFSENGTPARNWTGIKIEMNGAGDSMIFCPLRDITIYDAGVGIELETSSSRWINSNEFENINIFDSKVCWLFDQQSGEISHNRFINCNNQAKVGVTTDGFKNVNGDANQFIGCVCWDFDVTANEMNIVATAEHTKIDGGMVTGWHGTFANLGSETVIDDWKHGYKSDIPTSISVGNMSNVAYDEASIDFRMKNNANAEYIVGYIGIGHSDPTSTSEDAVFDMGLIRAGSIINGLYIEDNKYYFGDTKRLVLDPAGLTAARTFTFPDATTKLAGLSVANDHGDFDNSFKDNRIRIWNPADTFRYTIVAAAIAADRTLNLPLITATDTLSSLGLAQTFTAAKTYNNGTLKFRNPADTFSYTVVPSAIGADRNLTLPLVTADDTLAVLGLAQTYTGARTIGSKLDINKNLHRTGVISPAQLTADQDNYAPTNWATSSIMRLDGDTSFRSITGLGDATQTDGMVITVRNISANAILLKDASTNPAASSTAANRFDFNGYDIPIFPKTEIDIKYDSTLARWILLSYGSTLVIPPERFGMYFKHAFWNNLFGLSVSTPSGGSLSDVGAAAGLFGARQMSLGTTTTGFGMWKPGSNSIILLGNNWYWRVDWIIKVVALSDGTNTYILRSGFLDADNAEPTDGVYFRYTHSVNSGNWVLVARSNGTETVSNTSTAVQTSSFVRLTVIVNPAGTLAEYFINGVSVGTIATNIPTGAGRQCCFGTGFIKSAGTTDNAALQVTSVEVIGYANVSR